MILATAGNIANDLKDPTFFAFVVGVLVWIARAVREVQHRLREGTDAKAGRAVLKRLGSLEQSHVVLEKATAANTAQIQAGNAVAVQTQGIVIELRNGLASMAARVAALEGRPPARRIDDEQPPPVAARDTEVTS